MKHEKKGNLNKKRAMMATLLGLLLVVPGAVILKQNLLPQKSLEAIPYIMIGIGCGAFGQGIGELLRIRALKNSPKIRKKLEIEENDERNIFIVHEAKSRAFDFMTFAFSSTLLALGLMKADFVVLIILVCLFLAIQFYAIYLSNKFSREW